MFKVILDYMCLNFLEQKTSVYQKIFKINLDMEIDVYEW